jgi:tol-pal system protein YbgF
MQQHLNYRNGVIGLFLLTVTPFLFAAQNPVAVESREGIGLRPAQSTLPYQAPIEDEFADRATGETQYQVQLLQQEVQELRGLVEELQFQLQQMRTTQNDRYLELDSRVQSLTAQPGSTAGVISNSTGSESIGQASAVVGPDSDANVAVIKDEKTLYNGAVELIRARQYDLAISQLEAVIAQYPQGQFTANAYYWLGEVHAAKPEPDFDAARQALAQVITFFPDNRKVPDAAFKLGKVYHLTGDCDRARELLEQVITDHEGKTVARLAADYIRDRMGSCDTP